MQAVEPDWSARLYRVSVISLVIAAVTLMTVIYVESDENWAPAYLPVPGPGLKVREQFTLSYGGQFMVELQVPKLAAGDDSVRVPVDLRVTASGPDGFELHKVINRLDCGSHMPAHNVEVCSSDGFELPSRGKYMFEVANGGGQIFARRGAMLIVTRYVYPTEAYLRTVILRGIGWLGLTFGLAFWFGAELAGRRKRA